MKLYKNNNGDIYAYSDEDLVNLEAQGLDPFTELGLMAFSYTLEELEAKRIERDKQIQLNYANTLLNKSIKLESGVYQRRMSANEVSEFEAWQDELLAFINGNSETMPQTPEFINTLLGA